ncbi:MAG: hypothetical protein N3D10_02560 [Candidatus Micrarchaeota archaeon]|nr:hypothetical protein [Candidatus Micrarchaeota archaeon]
MENKKKYSKNKTKAKKKKKKTTTVVSAYKQINLEEFFNEKKNSKIFYYKKLSYFFWSLSILAALLTLIFIGLMELLWHFHILKPITSQSYLYSQFVAEVIALGILIVELAAGFIKASNKALFIKQNWLAIVAILPIGLFSRGIRTFELLGLLEELYLFRGFQLFGKFTEFEKIVSSSKVLSSFSEVFGRILFFISEILVMFARLLRIFK